MRILALLFLAFLPTTASAQQLFADSSVWRPAIAAVVERLEPFRLRAQLDTVAQPWAMRFPSPDARWATLERQLRVLLRARPVQPTDTAFYDLEIGEVTLQRDTARITVRTGRSRRCPGLDHLAGYTNAQVLLVPRAGRTGWGTAAFADLTIHGDRFSCEAARQLKR